MLMTAWFGISIVQSRGHFLLCSHKCLNIECQFLCKNRVQVVSMNAICTDIKGLKQAYVHHSLVLPVVSSAVKRTVQYYRNHSR